MSGLSVGGLVVWWWRRAGSSHLSFLRKQLAEDLLDQNIEPATSNTGDVSSMGERAQIDHTLLRLVRRHQTAEVFTDARQVLGHRRSDDLEVAPPEEIEQPIWQRLQFMHTQQQRKVPAR